MKLHTGIKVLKEHAKAAGESWKHITMYGRKLLTSKEKIWFDDRIERLIKEFPSEQPGRKVDVEASLKYLKELGFARSQYEYEPMEEALSRFEDENHTNTSYKDCVEYAVQKVKDEFCKLTFEPIQYECEEDLLKHLPKDNSHPGWSGIIEGIFSKKELIKAKGFKHWLKEKAEAIKNGSFNKIIVLGYRTQAGNPFNEDGSNKGSFKKKVRLVSMIDTWQIMAELMFAKPIQQYLSQCKWYAGGKDDATISNIVANFKRNFPFSITIDYTSFDQTISAWLIHHAFDIMECAFPNLSDEDKELFRVIRMDFIHKVFLDGHLKLRESHKGVPSGSMFTQIVDSIVNRIMIEAYMKHKGIEHFEMIIMGDDNLIFTGEEIDSDYLEKFLDDVFGVICNADKMSSAKHREGESPEFLSRTWTPQGVYREPHELLSKICYPEKRRNYKNILMRPEYIIEGYIRTFPEGMKYLINIREFQRKFSLKTLESLNKEELAVVLPNLPGSVQVQYRGRLAA